MKFLSLISLSLTSFLTASAIAATIDSSKSTVTWNGSKIVGDKHSGNISIKSANVTYTKGTPSSAKIVIDMNTMTNTDIKDKKYNAKMVKHLKSDDFFSVSKFKTAELNITKMTKITAKVYLMNGDLTIKGETQPVKFKAQITNNDKKTQTVTADMTFDRTKFGVKYGSGSFFTNLGDKVIADEVGISVKLHINK